MEITYVTGNKVKYDIAHRILTNSNITLIQKKLDTPEIQSKDVCEISEYSAKWALGQLKRSIVVTDAGFFIRSMNGFPGPFVKYFNDWFTTDDLLKMLEDKDDRTVVIRDCLTYIYENGDHKSFEIEINGKFSDKVVSSSGTAMEQLFIPDSLDCTLSELNDVETLDFWCVNSNFNGFVDWMENNPTKIKYMVC